MEATRYDLKGVKRGATYVWDATYKDSAGDPVDVSLWTAKCEIRSDWHPRGDEMLALTQADSADGKVTLSSGAGATPNVSVELKAAGTEKLTRSRYVYDVFLYQPGPSDDVVPLLYGVVEVAARAVT